MGDGESIDGFRKMISNGLIEPWEGPGGAIRLSLVARVEPSTPADYLGDIPLSEPAMASHARVLTADEVFDLPIPDDILGYECVNGQPVPVMPASLLHGELIVEVARRLANHVIEHRIPGKVYSDSACVLGIRRDRERTRSPDVSFISKAKIDAHPDPRRLFRGVPDLAIEIDLTSGKNPGGQQRILDYLEAGVSLIWSIDPDSMSAMAYRPDGSAKIIGQGGILDAEEVVPGFKLPLAELFE